MVLDEQIIGLCGGTRIANIAETFVAIIFTTKAFESTFDGVACFQYVLYQRAMLVLTLWSATLRTLSVPFTRKIVSVKIDISLLSC